MAKKDQAETPLPLPSSGGAYERDGAELVVIEAPTAEGPAQAAAEVALPEPPPAAPEAPPAPEPELTPAEEAGEPRV